MPASDKGSVAGRTYTNANLGFDITFPAAWLIPGDDFEAEMRKQGFDLGLRAPDSLPSPTKAKLDEALKNVTVLLTAYRSMPGAADNAIVRISVEDLKANPQIKDPIDYIDAVVSAYGSMRLPDGFKYSETKAETLGSGQFAYLDTSSPAGKKRMYVVVRQQKAILFTLSYTKPEDLETFRSVIGSGHFAVKR